MRLSEIDSDQYVIEGFNIKRLAKAGALATSIALSSAAAGSDMQILDISSQSQGYNDRDVAAQAFYQAHDSQYNQTNPNQEIVGYLLFDKENRTWHFTDPLTTSATFDVRIGIRKPKTWVTQDIVHTHPAVTDGTDQDGFSKGDVKVVTQGKAPGYYVRAPNGNIRYINKAIARSTGTKWGAEGKLVAQTDPHPRHQ